MTSFGDWQRHILNPDNCPPLPAGCTRPHLILYCFAMASHGKLGKGCFAGDATIAREIGIKNRNVVTKYRHLVKDLGWFVPNGETKNRVESLDWNIPHEVAQLEQAGTEETPQAGRPPEPSFWADGDDSAYGDIEDLLRERKRPGECNDWRSILRLHQ